MYIRSHQPVEGALRVDVVPASVFEIEAQCEGTGPGRENSNKLLVSYRRNSLKQNSTILRFDDTYRGPACRRRDDAAAVEGSPVTSSKDPGSSSFV